MIHQIRLGGIVAAVCLAAIAVALPASASASTCSPPAYPGSGYFNTLKVAHVSCKSGRTVTLAHYRCRTEHGKKGRCNRRVRGYKCSEHRRTIPTEIDSKVTCKKGSKRVIYTYQQNT